MTRKGYLKHKLGWSVLDVLEGENVLLVMVVKQFYASCSEKACKTLPIRKEKMPLFRIRMELHRCPPLTPTATHLPQ